MLTIIFELFTIFEELFDLPFETTTAGAPTTICSPSLTICARLISFSETPFNWFPAALIASIARDPEGNV